MTEKEKVEVLYEEHMKKVEKKENIKNFFKIILYAILLAIMLCVPWVFIVCSIALNLILPAKIIVIVLSSILFIIECALICIGVEYSEEE